MRGVIHFDVSTEVWYKSACGTTPNEQGSNLTLDETRVTCAKCQKKLRTWNGHDA